MSVKFQWAALNADAGWQGRLRERLESVLNDGVAFSAPSNVVGRFNVKDIYLGDEGPSCQILQVSKLSLLTQSQLLLHIKYKSNGYLVVTTHVQANPASVPTTATTTTAIAAVPAVTGTTSSANEQPHHEAMHVTNLGLNNSPDLSAALLPQSSAASHSFMPSPLSPLLATATNLARMTPTYRPLIVPLSLTLTDLALDAMAKITLTRRRRPSPKDSSSGIPSKEAWCQPDSPSSPLMYEALFNFSDYELHLVWLNDPLKSIHVSSSFDTLPKIQRQLQSDIETRLRSVLLHHLPLFLKDLPSLFS
jgi:hypothetical protein